MTEISEAAKAKAHELTRVEGPLSALTRLIQQVSDAVSAASREMVPDAPLTRAVMEPLAPFILPEPVDPLVEALNKALGRDADYDGDDAAELRAELAKRGLKIVEAK